MDKEELYSIGVKFRNGEYPNETWDSLNAKYNGFKNGESYRNHVRKKLKKLGLLPSVKKSDKIEVKEIIHNEITTLNHEYEGYKQIKSFKEVIELNKDGSQTSDKLIEINNELEKENLKDENYLLELHGYNKKQWQIVSARNSIWETQLKGGTVTKLYASKVSVKPRSAFMWSEEDVKKIFQSMQVDIKLPEIKPLQYDENGNILLIPLADFHFGLLSDTYSTGNDYNLKIAEEYYYYVLNHIINEIKGKKIKKILFVVGNDFINADNVNGTTTKGTPQDNAGLWFDIVNKATKLLINGIDLLLSIAPVDVIYVMSNHDLHTMFGIMQTLKAWFKDCKNVNIDDCPLPRKYYKYGKNLLMFSHDVKTKEALKIITSEAKQMWSDCEHMICMLAHLHQSMIYEKQGHLEIMRLPTISGWSRWSNEMGYIQSDKKNQSFIINEDYGILNVINTVIL